MEQLIKKQYPECFQFLEGLNIRIVSQKTILRFIDEELIHDNKTILESHGQTLHSMSTGERKRAFLTYQLSQSPSILILDHFFDNVDSAARNSFFELLKKKSTDLSILNIYSRNGDVLEFLSQSFDSNKDKLIPTTNIRTNTKPWLNQKAHKKIPTAIQQHSYSGKELVAFKDVNIAHLNKKILTGINWEIDKGQFWHLFGPNGSGKTTLLTMMTGDNPKAYGQNITLFGLQKGTGESIWDIKQKVGYFTTNMTFQFKRRQNLRDMIISGFFDSVGLYQKAGDQQIEIANQWLDFIGLSDFADHTFIALSLCHQRMVMIARAMVKHPLLLILDEPSVDLDEANAYLMTDLINRISKESETTLIYVSHRIEPGLVPTHGFELTMANDGSKGRTITY
jgi:molybdate transport system ATP-binding protein